jgi:hypothetical protein
MDDGVGDEQRYRKEIEAKILRRHVQKDHASANQRPLQSSPVTSVGPK